MKKSSQSEECEAQTFKVEGEKIEGKEKWYRENRDFLRASLKGGYGARLGVLFHGWDLPEARF